MNKKDIRNRIWVAIAGSVFCEDLENLKIDHTKQLIKVRRSVAFNVGDEVAEHMCNVHNADLKWRREQETIPVDMTENISKADMVAFVDELNGIFNHKE